MSARASSLSIDLQLPPPREWKLQVRYRLWQAQPRGALGPYYIDLDVPAGSGSVPAFDSSHDPLRVAEFALCTYGRLARESDESIGRSFLAAADWLRDATLKETDGAIHASNERARYGAAAGFLSARIQGATVSALLRAHDMEPHGGYLQAAIRAATPFAKRVGQGGVLSHNKAGDTFPEEIAVYPAAHLLGGAFIGLWGLFELQRYAHIAWLGDVLGSCIATLQRRLAHFDSGYWSYESALVSRDGLRTATTLARHDFHIAGLRVCASMMGERYFDAVADTWSGYVADMSARRRLLRNRRFGYIARALHRDDSIDAGARSIF